MLGRAHRMAEGDDFRVTVRRGAKGAAPTLVTHVVPGTGGVTSVGFVVSKAVGGAVDRNRVKRRLRHLMRERLDVVPPGSRIVVRALAASATADSETLGRHLDRSLQRAGASAGTPR